MSKQQVLIVEDDPAIAEILGEYLKDANVFVAMTGKQALEYLKSQQFAMLVLDLGLPDISGTDVLDAAGNVPTIVYTGGTDETLLAKCEARANVLKVIPKRGSARELEHLLLTAESKLGNLRVNRQIDVLIETFHTT